MDPILKHLVLDHLRRNQLMWWALGVAQLLMAIGYFAGRFSAVPVFGCLLIASEVGGAFGFGTKATDSLPLTRRQMGELRWWITMPIVGGLLTTINVIALSIAAAFKAIDVSNAISVTALTFGILGASVSMPIISLGVTSLLARLPSALRLCVRVGSFLLIAMAYVYTMVEVFNGWPINSVSATTLSLLCSTAIIAGLLSYKRADLLAPVSRSSDTQFILNAKPHHATKLKGWKSLYWQHAQAILPLLVFCAIGLSVLYATDNAFWAMAAIAALMVPILTPFLMAPWIESQRALQVLPMSASQVARNFLVLANLPTIAAMTILTITWIVAAAISQTPMLSLTWIVAPSLLLQSIALGLTLRTRSPGAAAILTFVATAATCVLLMLLSKQILLAALAAIAVPVFGVLLTLQATHSRWRMPR